MRYLLDTSVYSQPLKQDPVPAVVERWRAVGDLYCCVSVFSEMEVLQGLRLADSEPLTDLYREVLSGRLPVLDFTSVEAARYADLQAHLAANGLTRSVTDVCVAATALQHGCVVATLNPGDFDGIPGLRVEDWSR